MSLVYFIYMGIEDIDDRYTPVGLPKLTKDTINVYGRDMLVRDPSDARGWLDKIKDEDAWMAGFIAKTATDYPPGMKQIALMDLCSVYRVLRAQAENYKLEDSAGNGR